VFTEGFRSRSGSGSIQNIDGFGSWGPKNIRIHNTGFSSTDVLFFIDVKLYVSREGNFTVTYMQAFYSVIGTVLLVGTLPVLFVFLQIGLIYLAFLSKSSM
jgi:hypothetical protein